LNGAPVSLARNSAAEKSESGSEGGQKFLPPNPLPFCPPERSVSAAPRAAISRSFVQKRFELRSAIATKLDIRYLKTALSLLTKQEKNKYHNKECFGFKFALLIINQ